MNGAPDTRPTRRSLQPGDDNSPRPDAAHDHHPSRHHSRWSAALTQAGLWCGWLLFALHAAALLWIACRANLASTASGLIDDSYYYLEIGRRLAQGEGPTFDGVFATNGFHPFWQAVVAAVALMVRDPELYVRTVLVIGVVCFLSALLILVDVARRLVGIGPALFGALVAFHGVDRNVNGMESALSLLTVAALTWLLVHWDEQRSTPALVMLGAACALVVLARLDYGLVIWVVPVAITWRTRDWKPGLAVAGVAAAPLTLFAGWSWLTFGNPIPVSAIAKRAWVDDFYRSHGLHHRPSLGMLPVIATQSVEYLDRMWTVARLSGAPPKIRPREPVVAALALGGLFAVVNDRRRRVRRSDEPKQPTPPHRLSPPAWALTVTATIVTAKALIDITLSPNFALSWYSAIPRVAVPMMIGVLVLSAVRWLFDRAWWLGLIALALCSGMVIAPRLTDARSNHLTQADDLRWVTPLGEAGRWIRDHGPPGRYAALDAGILGFELHSSPHHQLINIDGMVNNHHFVRLVTERAPIGERAAFVDADFLVNRHDARLNSTDLTCATELWQSQPIGGYPIKVWDLRPCATTPR